MPQVVGQGMGRDTCLATRLPKASTKFLNAMPNYPNPRQPRELGVQYQDVQSDPCKRISSPSKKACNRSCKQLVPIESLYRGAKNSWIVSGLPSYAYAK